MQTDNHENLKKQLFNENCNIILTTKDDFMDLNQIDYTELTTGYFCAVIPKGYPLTEKNLLELKDLSNTNMVMLDSSWCPPKQFTLQQLITKHNSNLNLSYVNDVSTAYLMCKAGLGISIMPNFIAGKSTHLISVVPINYNVNLSYGIVKLKTYHMDYITQFISYFKKILKNYTL